MIQEADEWERVMEHKNAQRCVFVSEEMGKKSEEPRRCGISLLLSKLRKSYFHG